jgi:hypothetical protein
MRAAVAHISLFKGVPVVQDDDVNSTDLMKCIRSLEEKEKCEGADVRHTLVAHEFWRTGFFIFISSLASHFNRLFLYFPIRLATTSSCSVACLDGSTRPSTHYHFFTSFAKAGAGSS